MSSEHEKDFFREGLRRYAAARETVTYFQESVYNAIAKAFEQKQMWTYFEPARPDGNFESGKGMGAVFIHGYIAGRVPNRDPGKKAWLSLGLHWNTPLFREAPVVAVAQCWFDAGSSPVPFTAAPAGTGTKIGALYRKSDRRLLLPANHEFDPDTDFARLLDAADSALGPFDTPVEGS